MCSYVAYVLYACLLHLLCDADVVHSTMSMFQSYSTNGTILKDEEGGEIIQLQGDQRQNVVTFLTKCNIVRKEEIKVHGF